MPELRRNFHQRLTALEDEVLRMGQRVLRMLADVTGAIAAGDPERAAGVAAADEAVDASYRGVQEGLLALLALQAPVARDLRLVSALIHVSLHLERVGDLCVNMAKLAQAAQRPRVDPALSAQVQEMGEHAARVLDRSLQCFARRDVELARRMDELDDPLDRMNRSVFRQLVQLAAHDEQQIDWAFGMVLVARFLERIGDHAVDIAEQVEFTVTGAVSARATRRANGRASPLS